MIQELFKIAMNLPQLPGGSRALHDVFVEALILHGWDVVTEDACEYVTGKGRECTGRIDVIATKGLMTVAVELDNVRPRKGSLAKLSNCKIKHKVVLLRQHDGKMRRKNGIWWIPLGWKPSRVLARSYMKAYFQPKKSSFM